MKSIALGTYEIGEGISLMLSNCFASFNLVEYIDMAISYNNESYVKIILDNNPNLKVISKIAPQMGNVNYDLFVSSHLAELGHDVDIMLIHNNRCDWKPTAKYISEDKRFKEVGVSNFTIEDIEEFKNITGQYPSYLELEINPKFTQLDLISFCKEKEIKIIAYCIFGGKYNARRFIANYSIKGLINYALSLADIIIIRGDDFDQMDINLTEAQKLIQMGVPSISPKDADNKSMVPMVYTPPEYIGYDYRWDLPTFNTIGLDVGIMENNSIKVKRDTIKDFAIDSIESDIRKLEFISDIKVFLYYYLKYVKNLNCRWISQTEFCDRIKFPLMRELMMVSIDGQNFVVSLNIIDKDEKLSKIITDDCKISLTVNKTELYEV